MKKQTTLEGCRSMLLPMFAAALPISCPRGSAQSAGGQHFVVDGNGTQILTNYLQLIKRSEYEIRWQKGVSAFQSPNRRQNLRFTYWNNGFEAQRRVVISSSDTWSVRLLVRAYDDGQTMTVPTMAELNVNQLRARAQGPNFAVDYLNDARGMRQDFTVNAARGGGTLTVVIQAVLQGVQMRVDPAATYVAFSNAQQEIMRYGDLHSWDANGTALQSAFVRLSPTQFGIVVDSSEAVFPITIDPLSFYWGTKGDQDSEAFGFSVAYGNWKPGDVGDIAVGAPNYDDGQTDEGAVFVFYGDDTGTPQSPSWHAESDQAGAKFGYSVANADNVDDDPNLADDLLIGAPYYDHGSYTDNGRAFLYLGSAAGLSPTNGTTAKPSDAVWADSPSQSDELFGFSVASAGQVNNDSYADILVGAPFKSHTSNSGYVYAYYGGSGGPSTTNDWSTTDSQGGALFGFSVASAGDVDNDGFSDIVIGAPAYDDGQTDEGAATVYLGGTNGLASSAQTVLEINSTGAQFGHAVAGGDDVNGDGYDDIIVGAPDYANGQSNEGGAFVYEGSSTGIQSTISWSAESNQASAKLGWSVALMPDISGDSEAEVVVGAPYYTNGPNIVEGGGTFIWYSSSLGSSGNPSNADWYYFDQTSDYAHSGWSIATGDNIKYLHHVGVIIGAPDENSYDYTGAGAADAWAD